jgi:hypothetical protein
MIRELFSARVYQVQLSFEDGLRDQMLQGAMDFHQRLNRDGQPWARKSRQSLIDHESSCDVFRPLENQVREAIGHAYQCEPVWQTAREVITQPGQFIPLHAEDTDLSAVYWIDGNARPDPSRQDYSGAFVLVNPSGAYGSRKLPWEGWRSEIIHPYPGLLVIFPSYLAHHSHPYNGTRPSVEVHFEFRVQALEGQDHANR